MLVFILCNTILASSAHSEDQSEAELINFAFSNYLGTGFYASGGGEVFILRIPLSYTLRPMTSNDSGWVITYPVTVGSPEDVFEAGVEAGASNVESGEEQHEVTCDPDDFSTVRDALTERYGDPSGAELTWRPQNTVAIDEDRAQTMLKFLDTLDESDDVQRVAANFEISDEVMARLTA